MWNDPSDWEKEVKYHGKRRNGLVPVRKKIVHDFWQFKNTSYATPLHIFCREKKKTVYSKKF